MTAVLQSLQGFDDCLYYLSLSGYGMQETHANAVSRGLLQNHPLQLGML